MNRIEFGDCRDIMRRWAGDGVRVQTCVTSPPYFGLRDYGVEGQLGLEQTPDDYVANIVEVFRCVRDILADDGTLWLNLGDTYAGDGGGGGNPSAKIAKSADSMAAQRRKQVLGGLKEKNLIGIPWRVAFALQADGWYLRSDIIWHKPNPMPESVTDRPTKAHEYIFLLSKSPKYYYDHEAVKEESKGSWNSAKGFNPDGQEARSNGLLKRIGHRNDIDQTGRNRRSVWTVTTRPYRGAHFATFPPALIEPCILAGSRPGDVVLDPFMGSGTTAMVAIQHGRRYLGCELNPEYAALQQQRIASVPPLLQEML